MAEKIRVMIPEEEVDAKIRDCLLYTSDIFL